LPKIAEIFTFPDLQISQGFKRGIQMSKLHIEDIRITYQGCDLSQYGLFPLLAWYLMDVVRLPEYFEQITVNKKRDRKKSNTFLDSQMCMGLVSLPILGIPRISKINE
jgi:hypothetical protein